MGGGGRFKESMDASRNCRIVSIRWLNTIELRLVSDIQYRDRSLMTSNYMMFDSLIGGYYRYRTVQMIAVDHSSMMCNPVFDNV